MGVDCTGVRWLQPGASDSRMCFMRSPVILLHIEEQLGTTNETKEARMEPHELPRIR